MTALLSRRLAFGALCALALPACSESYKVGDHVLVEWGKERYLYPAFIVEKKSNTRFRVTFEGYPPRWDTDVPLARIKGFVQGNEITPPPPRHVQLITGMVRSADDKQAMSRYRVGERIRVRWRESTYRATVIEVPAPDRLFIHYDGHEEAWDEEIPLSRVVTRK